MKKGIVKFVCLALLGCAALSAHGEAVSDVFVAYSGTWRAGMGGTDQTNATIYGQFAGANNVAAASGSPHRMNVIGTKESAFDARQQVDCGGMIGWMRNYDVRVRDFIDVGNYLGADQFAYIGDMSDNGAAAQAEQPGRFSCYEQAWFYYIVVAHETGGHNFGLDHRVGKLNPKTVMMHNYCSGGAQSFFSNPNIWLNGAQLIGDGSCLGGAVQGGDAVYNLSLSAQGMEDVAERRVFGSVRYPITYRWQFNKTAGAAPAGTVISDEVANAQAIVRGQGATFTGKALRLPGGTTGDKAANSIAAYIDLPNGMFSSQTNFTIEIWAAPQSAQNWGRIIEIGRTTEAGDGLGAAGEYTGTPGSAAPGNTSSYDSITLTASIGDNLSGQRFEAKLGGTGAVIGDSTLATTAGDLHHYAITFTDTTTGGTVKWYRDGGLVKSLDVTFHSASLHDVNNWLGRSLWSGDSLANIDYYDVRVQGAALSDGNIAANYRIGPNDKVVTLWANDAFGNSGFINGAWEFGQSVPDASHDYEIGTLRLLSPWTTTDSTFPGRSLTVTGGNLYLAGKNAKTATINDLRLNGAIIHSFGDNGSTQTLAGNINVQNFTNSQIRGEFGALVISANIKGGVGGGSMTYTEKEVTLTGNNTGYLGATIVGDGRFSTLKISSETNLGGNPTFYGGAWLQLNRGILVTTATMTIDDANRGVLIGPSGGFLNPAAGTTLTIATTLNSPAAGNTLQTAPMYPNPVVGIFFVDGQGTVELTNPNNSQSGEMLILQGELRLTGNGRLNNGDHFLPFTINGVFTDNSALDQRLGGAISGTGSIVKNGTSTLTLAGANTFSGTVTLNGGTLYANSGNAANTRALSFVSSMTVNSGTTLRSSSNALFGWDGTQEHPITVKAGGTLLADGNSDVGVGTITLAGGTLSSLAPSTAFGSWRFDEASDTLNVSADSVVSATNVKFGNANAAINVSTGKTLNFTGTITDATSGGVSYLTKAGAGTLTLAGANTYTGATAINAGTLKLTGSMSGGGAVTVASGSILTGRGTINGATSFAANAIHVPGNPVGAQTFGGALSYANGARLQWALTTNSNAAGAASSVSAGAVTVASGAALDLVLNGAGSAVNYTNNFWKQNRAWTVVSSSGQTGTFALGTVSADAGARAASSYGTFSLTQGSSGVTLNWTPRSWFSWQMANFGSNASDDTISGYLANPDGDGVPNILEAFYGTDPNVPGASPVQTQTASGHLSLTFLRNSGITDVIVKVQGADAMTGPWTDLAQSAGGAIFTKLVSDAAVSESGAGAVKTVSFVDPYLMTDTAHPQRFLRLWIQPQ